MAATIELTLVHLICVALYLHMCISYEFYVKYMISCRSIANGIHFIFSYFPVDFILSISRSYELGAVIRGLW